VRLLEPLVSSRRLQEHWLFWTSLGEVAGRERMSHPPSQAAELKR
jgi:hypothetical protein